MHPESELFIFSDAVSITLYPTLLYYAVHKSWLGS